MVSKKIAFGLLLSICLAISLAPASSSIGFKPPTRWPPLPIPNPNRIPINLVAPTDGENVPDKRVTLVWDNTSPCNNPPTYEFWIDRLEGDGSWSNVVLENTGENKMVTVELPDGIYMWGVQVYQLGTIAGWSTSTRNFSIDTVPALAGNINISTTTSSAIISWKTDKPSASLLEYGTDIGFGSIVRTTDFTTDHSLTITGLAPATKYYFRARSVGVNGIENVFPMGEFFTQPEIAPALVYTKIPGEKISLLKNTEVTVNVLHPTISKLVLVSGENLYDVKFTIEESDIPLDPNYIQLFQYDIKINPGVAGSIEFRIATDLLKMYNIEEVHVLHYVNGSWVRLKTFFVRSDGPYCYYSAYTDSFSPFAAVGTAAVEKTPLGKNVSTAFPPVEETTGGDAWATIAVVGLGMIIILLMVLLKPYILPQKRK